MKSIPLAVSLLLAAVAAGVPPPSAAPVAEPEPGVVSRWEYRALTEEQVAALGKKGLTAGLNALGDEGRELVTAGAHYIFKRPKELARKQAAAQVVRDAVGLMRWWQGLPGVKNADLKDVAGPGFDDMTKQGVKMIGLTSDLHNQIQQSIKPTGEAAAQVARDKQKVDALLAIKKAIDEQKDLLRNLGRGAGVAMGVFGN
jgi:hypothetical protein